MLLSGNIFEEISRLLRKDGGSARQRQLRVDVTLATASGDLLDARIHHFAHAGVELITTTPLQPGDRFGFKVPEDSTTHFLFCEVLACRLTARVFAVSASFLAQEMRGSHHRFEMMN